MEEIWEAQDRFGRLIKFTNTAWEHILAEHADFEIEHQDIRLTIERAEEIVRDRNYQHREIHYRQYKSGPLWLRVIVHYRPTEALGWVGNIITAHAVRKRNKREVLIWPYNKRT
jgi:hypothetical protein